MELIAFLLPPLIDLINRRVVSPDVRFWVSVFVCALVGAGLNYLDTQFAFETLRVGFESLSQSILVVFGIAQLVYGAVYDESRLQTSIRG